LQVSIVPAAIDQPVIRAWCDQQADGERHQREAADVEIAGQGRNFVEGLAEYFAQLKPQQDL